MPSRKQTATSTSTKRAEAAKAAKRSRLTDQAKPTTKKQRLIDLLAGDKPVTVEMVSKTLDWQPHTVRAAITRLRKAGFAIDSSKCADRGVTCYRIVDHARSTVAPV